MRSQLFSSNIISTSSVSSHPWVFARWCILFQALYSEASSITLRVWLTKMYRQPILYNCMLTKNLTYRPICFCLLTLTTRHNTIKAPSMIVALVSLVHNKLPDLFISSIFKHHFYIVRRFPPLLPNKVAHQVPNTIQRGILNGHGPALHAILGRRFGRYR